MRRRTSEFRPDAPATVELSAGGVVMTEPDGLVLMIHDRSEDRWTLPKGHVERGESLIKAALREIREETGLTELRLQCELAESMYRFYDPEKAHNVVKVVIFYLFRTRATRVSLEETFDNSNWVAPLDAAELVAYDEERRFLKIAELRSTAGAKG